MKSNHLFFIVLCAVSLLVLDNVANAQTPTPTATPTVSATATPFAAIRDCAHITKKVRVRTGGTFLWKPQAAHFNTVVILAPRLYTFPREPKGPPSVSVYRLDGKLLFPARLKSYSVCSGVGEDLCASTYITPNGFNGAKIQRKYGSVIVRIKAAVGSTRGCRWYLISHPKDRLQYVNQ